jgi:hypothetical protein
MCATYCAALGYRPVLENAKLLERNPKTILSFRTCKVKKAWSAVKPATFQGLVVQTERVGAGTGLASRLLYPIRPKKTRWCVKTILILDNDLGFLFWVGALLHDAGHKPFPALSVSQATELVGEFNLAIDLLIANFAVSGAGDLARNLRHESHVRIVAALPPGAQLEQLPPDADVAFRKPTEFDEHARSEWLDRIRRVLGENTGRPGF